MAFGLRGRERLRFQLFDSKPFGSSDLLFKDVTEKLAILPDDMDISQVLGLDYVALLKGLGHEGSRFSLCLFIAPNQTQSGRGQICPLTLLCKYTCICRFLVFIQHLCVLKM